MKRAAGQIRKVRRNKDKDSNDDDQVQQPVRRKPTPEEAALTAKNYRLAKELSDLRVRHREECKAVTRLTMENMNLASRWREAISHVAMLKKELALHQRRAAEALAQQKAQADRNRARAPAAQSSESTQHNRPSYQTPSKNLNNASFVDESPETIGGGNSLQDVAAEMDRMDRILAAHQAQSGSPEASSPPPILKEATTLPTLGTPSDISKDSQDSHSLSFTDHDDDDDDGEEKKTQCMDQPVTPSPQKDQDIRYDEGGVEDEEDEAVDEFDVQPGPHQEDFFSMFSGGDPIDLDDLHVDDPPLELSPASVTPSESPPPSPPQQNDSSSSSSSSPDNFDEIQNDDTTLQTTIEKTAMEEQPGPPLFPMTASPKLVVKAKLYNEEFPADITSDVTNHPRSAERRTPSEFNDIAEEENVTKPNVTSRRRPPPPPLSGIDAFEASFATQFPDSFSPSEDNYNHGSSSSSNNMINNNNNSKENNSPETNNNEEEYNPFFPSPSKDDEEDSENKSNSDTTPPPPRNSQPPASAAEFDSGSSITSSKHSNSRRGQADNSPSPVVSGRPRSSGADPFFPATSPYNRENSISTTTTTTIPNIGNGRNLRNGISSSGNSSSSPPNVGAPLKRYIAESPPEHRTPGSNASVRYETPPHGQRSPELSASDGPKRPEKAGAAAARARYEKALQPRGFAGNARRFPRRAEREAERGASPVSASAAAAASANSNGALNADNTNDELQVNRSKLAMAQARVKERTAVYTGRAAVQTAPPLESSSTSTGAYASFRQNQWGPRPSPTDSVASKPWDEDIGDIPLGNVSSTIIGSNGSNANSSSRTNGATSHSNNSPTNNSPRLSYTRQSITRDRPWDRSNQEQQEAPSRISQTAAIRASTYLVQQEDSSNNGESPTSRFIAAGKSRRRVKQPISYAEPSLSSKLRRGDVFFPKVDQEETEEMRTRTSSIVHL